MNPARSVHPDAACHPGLRPLALPPADVPVPALGHDVAIRYSKITFLLGFVFGT